LALSTEVKGGEGGEIGMDFDEDDKGDLADIKLDETGLEEDIYDSKSSFQTTFL